MALRHSMPAVAEVPLERVFSKLQIVPAYKAPLRLEFRRNANLEAVVSTILKNSAVEIDAAAGAGKSTVLPLAIARGRDLLLLHLFPSRLLAYHTWYEMAKREPNVEMKFVDDVKESLPVRGIVYMSYSTFIARQIAAPFVEDGKKRVLLMDEVHDSDAYTYSVRKLARCMPGIHHVISATGTWVGESYRRPELPGNLKHHKLGADMTPEMWNPYDDHTRPWSVSSMRGNTIVFTDYDQHARLIVGEYNSAGVIAYRLSARMPVAVFQEAMDAWNDPQGPLVMLVLDSSFRSGFTFSQVCRILDTCDIKTLSVVEGHTEAKFRKANVQERYQAAHRGGRTEGSACDYYEDETPGAAQIVHLEGTEKDGAALIYRALGFQPTYEIIDSRMAMGPFPKNFTNAMNGATPLVLLPQDSMVTGSDVFDSDSTEAVGFISSEAVSAHIEELQQATTAQQLASVVDAINGDASRVSPVSSPEGKEPHVLDMDQLQEMLTDAVMADKYNGFSVEIGKYYAVAGADAYTKKTPMFPNGVASVYRCFETDLSPEDVVGCMDVAERKEAVSILLVRYNGLMAEFEAVSSMVRNVPPEAAQLCYFKAARDWICAMLERASVLHLQLRKLAAVISPFATVYHFRELSGLPDVVSMFQERCGQALHDAIEHCPDEEAMEYVTHITSDAVSKRLSYTDSRRISFCESEAVTSPRDTRSRRSSRPTSRASNASSKYSVGSCTELAVPKWLPFSRITGEVVDVGFDSKGREKAKLKVTTHARGGWGKVLTKLSGIPQSKVFDVG